MLQYTMLSVKESGVDRLRARTLKIAFESLYGPLAWAYDWVSSAFFRGQWRVWQRASMRFVEGTRVLEVGIGTGNLQLDLVKAGYEVWGIDLSPQMLRQTARKAGRLGQRLSVCRARGQALPFPAACFDSVVSTFPSDYIAAPATLSEISRVLRSSGRFVIVPGGWLKPRDAKGKLLEGFAGVVYGGMVAPDLQTLERELHEGSGRSRWIGLLKEHTAEAGFSLAMHLVSNDKGACLVLVADKP
jgi:ubiquinone/menaquinone biosynthesis C-methylase UbiE